MARELARGQQRKATAEEDDSLLNRRDYLRMGAYAAAAGSTAAVVSSGSAKAATTRHGISFDRVVNIVDDYGADPTGTEPVNSALEQAASDGTLIKFPEGSYKFSGKYIPRNNRLGFLGEGDVKFVPPNGYTDLLIDSWSGYDEILIENIDIDIRDESTTAGIRLKCQTKFHLEDIEYLGRGITAHQGQISAFLLALESADGEGVLKKAVAKKGSRFDGYEGGNGRIGVWIGWSNKGTIRLEECDFREFGNNACYTSRTPGNVQIVDSYFLNNNASQIRLSGKGSYVKNCVLEIDFDKYTGPKPIDTSNEFGIRGISVDQGVQQDVPAIPAGAEIVDCDIIGRNAPQGVGLINVSPQGRSVTVKNTRIQCDLPNTPAVRRGEPGAIQWRPYQQVPPKPHYLHLENCSITGSADGREAVFIDSADGSSITDCCIQQTGSGRSGVRVVNSNDVNVTNSTINVSGTAVDYQNSTGETAGIEQSGSCPVPSTKIGASSDQTDSDSDAASTQSAEGDSSDSKSSGDETESDSNEAAATDSNEKVLTINGVESPGEYVFSVSGDLQKSEANGATVDDNDDLSGTTARGQVEGGIDSYTFTGSFTRFDVTGGNPTITVNGEAIDPSSVAQTADDAPQKGVTAADSTTSASSDAGSNSGSSSGGSATDATKSSAKDAATHTIALVGAATGTTTYTFNVSGSVSEAADSKLDLNKNVFGTNVEGAVSKAAHSYQYSGEITDISVDGPADIYVDGIKVRPEEALERLPELPNLLILDGDASDDVTGYMVSVDGELVRSDALSSAPEDATTWDRLDDTVKNGTVTGVVAEGTDAYRFDGDVTKFKVRGSAAITFEDLDG
ncbi:hypothetical protein ACFQH3_11505 [Haladaptatus sp. GCM10025707]|uniref:hypothetical protein n=1 Tax=unclassified Haladaptatus TaxID=2622732 RepID=UPI0023E81361|nr:MULTISPECIES: hypothetical protein [unclassified Haladaptatus]